MSHFAVMVVGDVDKQLAPFDENIEVEEYRQSVSKKELDSMLSYYRMKNLPYTDNIKECYDHYGKEWNDNEWKCDGEGWFYLSRYNPLSKWDWYAIGGRFSGCFITKVKKEAEDFVQPDEYGNVHIDSIQKKYIDLDGIKKEEEKEARNEYKIVASCFENGQIPRIKYKWSDVLNMKDLTPQEKRKLYFSQEGVELFNKRTENITSGTIEMYQCTEDEFVAERVASAFQPFAIVKDGIWYERAKMGWWAITSDEKSPQEWTEIFEKIWNEIDDDEMITFVDCHI